MHCHHSFCINNLESAMKKNLFALLLFLLLACFVNKTDAQDIQVIVHETNLQDTLGVLEIVFDFEIINISQSEQIIFEVRTLNNLPQDWTSSLCFGQTCFASHVDSIVTAPPFPDPPLQPGDTLFSSLHVTPVTVAGTGYVQLQIGTFSNPNDRITLDFVATAVITDINDLHAPFAYSLDQNYPNPFNPSTIINFSLAERGHVSIKLYDVLGNEIAVLLNEERHEGIHNLTLNTHNYSLSSGVYFYTLRANNFVQSRKMILEK